KVALTTSTAVASITSTAVVSTTSTAVVSTTASTAATSTTAARSSVEAISTVAPSFMADSSMDDSSMAGSSTVDSSDRVTSSIRSRVWVLAYGQDTHLPIRTRTTTPGPMVDMAATVDMVGTPTTIRTVLNPLTGMITSTRTVA